MSGCILVVDDLPQNIRLLELARVRSLLRVKQSRSAHVLGCLGAGLCFGSPPRAGITR